MIENTSGLNPNALCGDFGDCRLDRINLRHHWRVYDRITELYFRVILDRRANIPGD
jgi:hypothetical protein